MCAGAASSSAASGETGILCQRYAPPGTAYLSKGPRSVTSALADLIIFSHLEVYIYIYVVVQSYTRAAKDAPSGGRGDRKKEEVRCVSTINI